jgi:peroxiredoxin Q/BCP
MYAAMMDRAKRRRRAATESSRSLGVIRHAARGAGAAAILLLGALPAAAALRTGAPAPDFTAQAALGGTVKDFDLKAALAKGPVVLYFFPKAFTSGCTIEAHAFSDHIADFRRYGATVIGVSSDDIETQKRFSTQECRSNFLVASDPKLAIAREYDAVLMGSFANRTSYVIDPNGKVIEAFTNLAPLGHIDNALNALRDLKEKS